MTNNVALCAGAQVLAAPVQPCVGVWVDRSVDGCGCVWVCIFTSDEDVCDQTMHWVCWLFAAFASVLMKL